MNTILKITGICMLSAAFALVSCEDSLDTTQHGVESFQTFYQTDEEAEQAAAAIYVYYGSSGTQYNIWFMKNLLSDDFWCGGGGRGDNPTNEQLNEYTFGTDHPYMRDAFQNYYGIIYRANVILENVPANSAAQKQARAEAKVFRALAYIELISMWGTPPYVDHLLASDEYKQGNGNPEELWALVETDLSEAIASNALYEKSGVNDNSSYHVSKQFAQSLLGKAYVFQEKWTQAAQTLDQVISSGKYDLFRGDYGDMLQYDNENNCESLFEINFLNDPNNAQVISMLFAMLGWRTDQMNINPASDIYIGTWGFGNPQKDLYDAFVAEEGANGYRLCKTMITFEQMTALGHSIISGKELYGVEGLLMWKTRKRQGELNPGGWMDSHNNIRIMRYAEVLLLAAEAHFKGGNGSKAAEYVNLVRTRAQLAPKSSVTMDDIILEKRLELCGESVRYQDMLRWRIADKMVNQGKRVPLTGSSGTIRYVEYNAGESAGFKTSKHWLLPFPQAEMDVNENITQNAGW